LRPLVCDLLDALIAEEGSWFMHTKRLVDSASNAPALPWEVAPCAFLFAQRDDRGKWMNEWEHACESQVSNRVLRSGYSRTNVLKLGMWHPLGSYDILQHSARLLHIRSMPTRMFPGVTPLSCFFPGGSGSVLAAAEIHRQEAMFICRARLGRVSMAYPPFRCRSGPEWKQDLRKAIAEAGQGCPCNMGSSLDVWHLLSECEADIMLRWRLNFRAEALRFIRELTTALWEAACCAVRSGVSG